MCNHICIAREFVFVILIVCVLVFSVCSRLGEANKQNLQTEGERRGKNRRSVNISRQPKLCIYSVDIGPMCRYIYTILFVFVILSERTAV